MWTESAVKLIKLSYTSCSTQAARVSSSVIGAHYNITKKERRHLNFCVRSTTAHRGSVGEGRETKKKKCPPRPELTWKDTKGRKKHPIRAFMCLWPGRGESRLSPWPGFVSATLLCNSVSLSLSLSLSLPDVRLQRQRARRVRRLSARVGSLRQVQGETRATTYFCPASYARGHWITVFYKCTPSLRFQKRSWILHCGFDC